MEKDANNEKLLNHGFASEWVISIQLTTLAQSIAIPLVQTVHYWNVSLSVFECHAFRKNS